MNPASQIKYLLFDLDGTLLHFDLQEFISGYLSLICEQFADYPWRDQVPDWIMAGTGLMLHNDGQRLNRDLFLEYFTAKSGLPADEVWLQFMNFYEQKFDSLQKISKQDIQAINIMEKTLKTGYKLILATQPVFPELAIRKRLAWAGLAHMPFILITDIEKMSACKPSPRYFEQVMDLTGAQPHECLMIGNDPVTDMAAVKKDILTFFVTVRDNAPIPPAADYSGGISDLAALLCLN